MKFRAKVIPSGNATGIEIPADVMNARGSGARPLIAVTINGPTTRKPEPRSTACPTASGASTPANLPRRAAA
jgi:hypothetical protein